MNRWTYWLNNTYCFDINHSCLFYRFNNWVYNLEYVYNYRAEDSRMNCFFNKNCNSCYFTAALGVILNQDKNTQKFFGGGQTDKKSKQVARDDMYHTNDITAMDMLTSRGVLSTGLNGSAPVAFTWDATTWEKKGRYKLDKGSREVTAIAISQDGKYVAMCVKHNNHDIFVFELVKGTQVKKTRLDLTVSTLYL